MANDAAHGQPARPSFQRIELAGRVAAADHRADRSTNDDVRDDAVRHQRAHDADMGKAAGSAAAERKPDARAARSRLDRAGAGVRRTVTVAVTPAREKSLKHQTFSPQSR